jgi:hypothetical protein
VITVPLLVVTFGLGSLYLLRFGSPWAARLPYVVESDLLVVRKAGAPGPGGVIAPVENFIDAHAIVFRSPLIVEKAVKKRGLQELSTFAGQDPVPVILRDLKVTVVKENTNILHVSYECLNIDDGTKILAAIIESYQEFLDSTYNDPNGSISPLQHDAEILTKELLDISIEHRNFIALHPGCMQAQPQIERYATQYFQAQSTIKRLQTDRDVIGQLGADNLVVQLDAKKWAKENGLDPNEKKVQELVQIYMQFLADEIAKQQTHAKTIENELQILEGIKAADTDMCDKIANRKNRLDKVEAAILDKKISAGGFYAKMLGQPTGKRNR